MVCARNTYGTNTYRYSFRRYIGCMPPRSPSPSSWSSWSPGAEGDSGEQERAEKGGSEAGASHQEDQHCLIGDLILLDDTYYILNTSSGSGTDQKFDFRMTKFASTASQSVTPWIKIYSYNFSSLQTNSTLSPLLVKTQTHWIKGKPYLMYLESKFDWIPPKVDIIFYDVHALDVWLKFIKSILLVSHYQKCRL